MIFKSRKSSHRSSAQARNLSRSSVSTRHVVDRRWISCSQLELGMYVNELDKPWEQTRFLFQGFRIDDIATLRAVQETCEYVNVQTEKVALISQKSANRHLGKTGHDISTSKEWY